MTDKSAFPHPEIPDPRVHGVQLSQAGMSMREWQWTQFAAAALAGINAYPQPDPSPPSEYAKDAIDQADAMMAEIEKREQQDDK